MRNRRGGALIGLGLGLLAAALCLAAYNLYDGVRAGKASAAALDAVLAATQNRPDAAESASSAPDDTPFAPDGVSPLPGIGASGQENLSSGSEDGSYDEKNGFSGQENEFSEQENGLAAPEDGETAPGETEIPDYVLNPAMEMPETAVDGASYIGVLQIPALGLSLPVIGEWSDDGAKLAPCRYAGSAYTDDLVIAGHNYRTHFGSLGRLSVGDEVTFCDLDGNVFVYRAAAKETLAPEDTEEMTDSGWALTLFTCTTGGAYRLAIRCERAAAP
ncbi:MAG: sortase [Eubacteriales bacterium]|nr:sortase [Eubacteriales bacterium]